ncbi:hypothetical protein [Microbacterium sp.]|uniref:hypothetical protein n=1 Tax=Microbacterium sp. TaxID=51671 RepID=UPI003C77ABB3
MSDNETAELFPASATAAIDADTTPAAGTRVLDSDATPGPRVRWAGMVWGLVLAALAGAGIWLAADEQRIDDLSAWAQNLQPATAVAYALIAVGVIALVTGLVGLLHRAQRALEDRRAPQP